MEQKKASMKAEMAAGSKVLPPVETLDHSMEQKMASMMAEMMARSKVLPLAALMD